MFIVQRNLACNTSAASGFAEKLCKVTKKLRLTVAICEVFFEFNNISSFSHTK